LVPDKYKKLPPFKVKASDFGAPTTRTRVFFIGYDPRRVNSLSEQYFMDGAGTRKVTVAEALSGIPELGAAWSDDNHSFEVAIPKSTHFGNRLKGVIPPNVGDVNAIRKYKETRIVTGFQSTTHTQATITRFSSLAIGKADPVSKGIRLNPDGYCPTLRAGTGPERGSYQAVRPIHPYSPRVICPREAARLQGFPDWFQFDATKWHSFRQIGNSVSPIIAEMILEKIYRALR
jgi:DNA (cytosine-5)-methyltransferase 1